MGAKSEFEAILDKLLKPAPSFDFKNTESHPGMNYSEIHFSFGPLNQKVFSRAAFQNYGPANPVQKPKVEPIKVEPPKKRIQRKLNFDQSKALTVFVRFGEEKINDYSSDDEIKSAYRRLARKFHPDLNKGGTETFKVISLAFQKLVS
jgi:hypothetical protein